MLVIIYLSPNALEYQSAMLDCIYHTAIQPAGGDILDITAWYFSYHQWWLIEILWQSHLDLFITASGNVYQWSTEPYMEEAFNNVQHKKD